MGSMASQELWRDLLLVRKHKIGLIAVLALGVVILWWFFLRPSKSPEEVARQGIQALQVGQVDVLIGHGIEEEAQRLGMSMGEVKRFLAEFVRKGFQGLESEGSALVKTDTPRVSATAAETFRVGDRSLMWSLTAEKIGAKVVLQRPLQSATLFVVMASYGDFTIPDKRRRLLDALTKCRAQLERYGMHGMEEGRGYMTWGEFENSMLQRIADQPFRG
jgi:uncharacterized protein YjeT (DUF2065 family)